MNYSKAIRLVRSTKGLSQKDLAKKSKIDPSFLSLIERDKRLPGTKTLEMLSKALGVPLYLIILLASEKKDLRGLSEKQSAILGKQFLELIALSDK